MAPLDTARMFKNGIGLFAKPFLHLCWQSAISKYRVSIPLGFLLLCLSVVDVLVYAAVLAAVVESVFALGGQERFVLTLIGLIAFRWTLSCAIQASRTAHIARLHAPWFFSPVVVAVVFSVAGPTLIFVISSFFLIAGLLVASGGSPDLLHMLGWGLFAALVQLTWNCALALLIIYARLRQLLLTELPIIFVAILVLIISPVAYQFRDIPPAASRMLTSLNPASHLIAAYQNALWYSRNISLEVLPLSALIAVAVAVAMSLLIQRSVKSNPPIKRGRSAALHWNGAVWRTVDRFSDAASQNRYARWDGELPWISGANLIALLEVPRRNSSKSALVFSLLAKNGAAEGLLGAPLPILSHKNRDRLCAALALGACVGDFRNRENVISFDGTNRKPVVLDCLFDDADSQELAELSQVLREFQVGPLYLISDAPRVTEILLEEGRSEAGSGGTNALQR